MGKGSSSPGPPALCTLDRTGLFYGLRGREARREGGLKVPVTEARGREGQSLEHIPSPRGQTALEGRQWGGQMPAVGTEELTVAAGRKGSDRRVSETLHRLKASPPAGSRRKHRTHTPRTGAMQMPP